MIDLQYALKGLQYDFDTWMNDARDPNDILLFLGKRVAQLKRDSTYVPVKKRKLWKKQEVEYYGIKARSARFDE